MDGGLSSVSASDGRHGWTEMGEANQRVKISCPSYSSPADPVFHYMLIQGSWKLTKEKS